MTASWAMTSRLVFASERRTVQPCAPLEEARGPCQPPMERGEQPLHLGRNLPHLVERDAIFGRCRDRRIVDEEDDHSGWIILESGGEERLAHNSRVLLVGGHKNRHRRDRPRLEGDKFRVGGRTMRCEALEVTPSRQ